MFLYVRQFLCYLSLTVTVIKVLFNVCNVYGSYHSLKQFLQTLDGS